MATKRAPKTPAATVEDAPAPESTPTEPTPRVKVTATCPWCGTEFESFDAVLCSKKCNRAVRRRWPSSEVTLEDLPAAIAAHRAEADEASA